jgi:hypothetical protein
MRLVTNFATKFLGPQGISVELSRLDRRRVFIFKLAYDLRSYSTVSCMVARMC